MSQTARSSHRLTASVTTIDAEFANNAIDESLITSFADNKRHACSHSPLASGGKVIENHDALASIDQLMHHVAADIASSAGDQDRHVARAIAVSLGPTLTELKRRIFNSSSLVDEA
jgi:hypothetical protein